jgi:hypothetical protein
MKITLKNYRAFSDESPVVWDLDDGFTAFVGVNNSGKSSLLRFFHEARPSFAVLRGFETFRDAIMEDPPFLANFNSVVDRTEVFCNRNNREMTATFSVDHPGPTDLSSVTLRWNREFAQMAVDLEFEGARVNPVRGTFEGMRFRVKDAAAVEREVNFRRYVTLFDDLEQAVYLGPFRNAVNVGGASEYYDLRIGEQFISQWDDFKTGSNRQANRAALAVERELEGIFGIERLELNAAPGNQTMHVIVDGEPYQLQEQGAGFAQFIVVLAFVATRRPTYIFIDEPELNLHPSLQLDFLTALAGWGSKGLVFATHSIGLARATAERVYSVRARTDRVREVRPLPATRGYVEFLGEMSFSGYSDLGFQRVLLVEGSTEVAAVQALLRLYGIEHRVVLIPLGGSSLINAHSTQALAEIQRITSDVSVLIDSERRVPNEPIAADRQAFVDGCQQLGFDIHVMSRRALENYFPDQAIKATKSSKYRALDPFEALGSADPVWAKNENWRITAEMTRIDLEGTDLDTFFSSLASKLENSVD